MGRTTQFNSPEKTFKGSVTIRLDAQLADTIFRIARLAELTATEVLNRIVADQLPYVYIDEVPVVRKEMRIAPHEEE